MDTDGLLRQLADDGPALADAAERAGDHAAVPACPDWRVRDLVVHTGGVHRWAEDIVGHARDTIETALGSAVGDDPPGEDLLTWFRDGHATLVRTLRAAPAGLDCATFLPAPSPREFWTRRQAHETAIHRADAESATGRITPFDAAFAQDGIGELLQGFARRRSNAVAEPGILAIEATDGPSWLVRFGGERISAARQEARHADATVRGSSSDLYLWLWHRPSSAVVTGDDTVSSLWDRVCVTWS